MSTQLILLVSALFAGAIFVCMTALAQRPKPVTLRNRLENLGGGQTGRPGVVALEQLELSKPFAERVIRPGLKRISKMATRLAPGSNTESIANKLAAAGNPRNLTVETFL